MNKILVIEDDKDLREGILDLMTEEGYEVLEAVNGRKGIEIAKRNIPDLIISDILMPEADGYEVFKELKENTATSGIPFIFLSARAEISDIRHGMNLGADDYLTKPYKADDLIAAVKSKLSRKNYIDKKIEDMHVNIAKSLPHEMRTPLTSVIGFSQLILDHHEDLNNGEILDMVSRINNSGMNLLNIIQKFLLFSELEIITADGSQLKKYRGVSDIPAKEAIYSAVKSVVSGTNRNPDLHMSLSETRVNIDYHHLKFITEELVGNACKFSKVGTEIKIETYADDDNFVFEITDKGIGMTSEQIKNIGILRQFDRDIIFQDGLGLSLGIIGKILDLYGGSMEVQSEPGNYTKVKIKLIK